MILQNVGWLLHHCSKLKAYRHGQSLHAFLIKTSTQSQDVFLSNHLINMYAKCNDINAARHLFDEMPQRNLVSWSAIISGCYQSGYHFKALKLFSNMNLEPNEFVYASVISACAALSSLWHGKQIHAKSVISGFDSVSFVSNSLMSMYMSCGFCDDAYFIFCNTTENSSVVSYNALITGFAENMQPQRGLDVFKLMCGRGVVPDQFTLVGVLGICTETKDLWRGVEIHCMGIKLGLDSVAFVGNVILIMYSKCNLIDEMEKSFSAIEENDVISWNTIISACSLSGDHAKGLRYFKDMIDKGIGITLDDFTFASALTSCAGIASIHHGKQIHANIIRRRLNMDVGVSNALVNMYAKCGSIQYAITTFDRLKHRNLVTWNTIIAALGNHGLGRRALSMFEEMKMLGVTPDSVTFIGLLASCNHSGLVNEGETCFNAMKEKYGIFPEIEHLSCLIDLLGKAGRLKDAKEYLEKFPFGHDIVVLGSLLSACRLHGNVAVGEWVASRLMELQPVASSPYVLMSNIYALTGRWDEVADTRKMLKDSGVKKEAGYSLVAVKGVAEKFTVADFSHRSMQEIKDVLRNLNLEVSRVHL
ncbi:Pentatricopeptide repeat [Thalictrum thalictroides]|uniref:Pentatricopeptide repeat n=1 Tax=Thalictrum thalictroides TaxID=46969 RepID=A0A7J6W8H5_THATH|nr:Pentatricopeptide repeat [Thalictrum thalictroides]